MTSVFRNVIDFLGAIGVYDVVLPFLLIFTILFAVLDRTKVLGVEKVGGTDYPRRSLNSLVAFVVGFLVVASSRLVALINQAVAQTMVLLLLGIFFLVLIGAFAGENGSLPINNTFKGIIASIMGIGILLVFLNAIRLNSGVSVLEFLYNYVIQNASGTIVGTVIFLGIVLGVMYYITGGFGVRQGGSE